MSETHVEVPVRLDKNTVEKLNKMTKAELVNRICEVSLEAYTYRLRCQTAMEGEREFRQKIESLQTRLDKAEAYVEQGRAMIGAVMERWYEYDT